MDDELRVSIIGAGSIGCYIGGRLAAAGARVHLVGRARIGREIEAHGLTLTDYRGAEIHVAPGDAAFDTEPHAAARAAAVLVTVKSAATREGGKELRAVLPEGALVVSFQNGIGNAAVLRQELPGRTVLTGMVPFNVLSRGEGRFHQGSSGDLEVERHPRLDRLLPAFARAGLPLVLRDDILEVQWAKLLLNLNNPINALSNLPLRDELSSRAYRRCLALAQREGLSLLDAAGIAPARLTKVPARWIPTLLGLPDPIFRRVAAPMLAIDPLARSSMWEDLEAGRRTEIDWINGEVVRLAEGLGRRAPVNARLVELIRAAEAGERRAFSGEALFAELRGSLG